MIANLLGMVVTWLTFPGVILHELSHKIFCDLARVPVFEVKYFGFGNPAGYVLHGEVPRYRDAFLIAIAPFLVNSLAAMVAFAPACFDVGGGLRYVFLWLGISFAMHAFPSDGDARNLWERSGSVWRKNPLALVGFPVVALIMIANVLRIVWFDLIYAGCLFGVTFALLSAALTGGSAATGWYSVEIVSADDDAATGIHADPTVGGSGPTSRPDTRAGVAGREAPAKDWLPLAQDAMKEKDGNAVLITVNGRSNDAGARLPLDGRCHVWTYEFATNATDTLYIVTARDGSVNGVRTVALSSRSVETLLYRYGDPTILSWTVESDEAAAAAGEKYRELKGDRPPVSAAYKLSLSSWHQLAWMVYNYDATSKVTANIGVDPESGAIVHSWAPRETGTTITTDVKDPDSDDDGYTDGEEFYDQDYSPIVFEER